jgi:hypothetical protein
MNWRRIGQFERLDIINDHNVATGFDTAVYLVIQSAPMQRHVADIS